MARHGRKRRTRPEGQGSWWGLRVASTAVPTVGSIPWHPPAAQPRPVSPPGTRQASCLAPPGLKEQHRSAQNRERRKHSLFLPLPPSRAGGQCRLPGQGSRLPPCPALRRGRETEARPLPTLRAGRGGGRTRCPGSRPQPRHCHGSPAGSWCRGAPCPAGRAGAAGANRLFALPAFPPPAWSRRPRSIPTPRGGTVPPDAGPRFPEGPPVAMCRAPPSCPTLAWGGGTGSPPDSFPTVRGGLSPGEPGGGRAVPGCAASPVPLVPPRARRDNLSPRSSQTAAGRGGKTPNKLRWGISSLLCPRGRADRGHSISCRRDGKGGRRPGPAGNPPRAGRCLGARRYRAAGGKGLGMADASTWGGLGRGHEFPLKGLLQPQAPGKSCFSVSTWKRPRFPPKAGGEELQGEVYRSMIHTYILISQIIGKL